MERLFKGEAYRAYRRWYVFLFFYFQFWLCSFFRRLRGEGDVENIL
ncbi:MAG: hypothetical protein LBJ00_01845 [Planctomycetaceae bacterium]|nr:hypothetical protein [Planctomycetaceae bacterium]